MAGSLPKRDGARQHRSTLITLWLPGVLLLLLLLLLLLVSSAAKGFLGRTCEKPTEGAGAALAPHERSAIVAIVRAGRTECSGVLVGPSQVLTAAHCLKIHKGLDVLFEDESGCGSVTRRVSAAAKRAFLDAGVLEIATPAPPWVVPLGLASDESHAPAIGEPVLVAGRGKSSTELELGAAAATVIGSGTELVVEYPGQTGLCRGDSGGPLVRREGNGRLLVWGILRGGDGDCHGPDRFTRTARLMGLLDNVGTRSTARGE